VFFVCIWQKGVNFETLKPTPMKRLPFLALTLGIMLVMAACQSDTKTTTTAVSGIREDLDRAALTDNNLRLVPLVTDDASAATPQAILTLTEALKTQGFKIQESDGHAIGHTVETAGGAVNQLSAYNRSNNSVYLMTGEVVHGGKQDRVIAEDQIIAAKDIKSIPVYCVEHGRWTPLPEAAKTDNEFVFTHHASMVAGGLRDQLYSSTNQSAVWQKVEVMTDELDAKSNSGTYNAINTNEKYIALRKQLTTLARGIETQHNGTHLVGFAIYQGDKLIGADLFGSSDLLARQLDVVMGSHAAELLTKKPATKSNDKLVSWANDAWNGKISTGSGYGGDKRLLHAGF
jgi:hypothetical protein